MSMSKNPKNIYFFIIFDLIENKSFYGLKKINLFDSSSFKSNQNISHQYFASFLMLFVDHNMLVFTHTPCIHV